MKRIKSKIKTDDLIANGLIRAKDKRSNNTWTKIGKLAVKRNKKRRSKNTIAKQSRKRNR
jgi:hypothetical protein